MSIAARALRLLHNGQETEAKRYLSKAVQQQLFNAWLAGQINLPSEEDLERWESFDQAIEEASPEKTGSMQRLSDALKGLAADAVNACVQILDSPPAGTLPPDHQRYAEQLQGTGASVRMPETTPEPADNNTPDSGADQNAEQRSQDAADSEFIADLQEQAADLADDKPGDVIHLPPSQLDWNKVATAPAQPDNWRVVDNSDPAPEQEAQQPSLGKPQSGAGTGQSKSPSYLDGAVHIGRLNKALVKKYGHPDKLGPVAADLGVPPMFLGRLLKSKETSLSTKHAQTLAAQLGQEVLVLVSEAASQT